MSKKVLRLRAPVNGISGIEKVWSAFLSEAQVTAIKKYIVLSKDDVKIMFRSTRCCDR